EAAPELATLLVLRRGQRLSVMPVTESEFTAVLRRGRAKAAKPPRDAGGGGAPAARRRAGAARSRGRKAP
ncbi:MAG TPA: hypothetical protein VGR31_16005, partial [Planctomycetota bacterium]|nr:hypothetical protein [Planctomycetota bacterium]